MMGDKTVYIEQRNEKIIVIYGENDDEQLTMIENDYKR